LLIGVDFLATYSLDDVGISDEDAKNTAAYMITGYLRYIDLDYRRPYQWQQPSSSDAQLGWKDYCWWRLAFSVEDSGRTFPNSNLIETSFDME
jgi:hypothetical protein